MMPENGILLHLSCYIGSSAEIVMGFVEKFGEPWCSLYAQQIGDAQHLRLCEI